MCKDAYKATYEVFWQRSINLAVNGGPVAFFEEESAAKAVRERHLAFCRSFVEPPVRSALPPPSDCVSMDLLSQVRYAIPVKRMYWLQAMLDAFDDAGTRLRTFAFASGRGTEFSVQPHSIAEVLKRQPEIRDLSIDVNLGEEDLLSRTLDIVAASKVARLAVSYLQFAESPRTCLAAVTHLRTLANSFPFPSTQIRQLFPNLVSLSLFITLGIYQDVTFTVVLGLPHLRRLVLLYDSARLLDEEKMEKIFVMRDRGVDVIVAARLPDQMRPWIQDEIDELEQKEFTSGGRFVFRILHERSRLDGWQARLMELEDL